MENWVAFDKMTRAGGGIIEAIDSDCLAEKLSLRMAVAIGSGRINGGMSCSLKAGRANFKRNLFKIGLLGVITQIVN
jgi:hypothetical protein